MRNGDKSSKKQSGRMENRRVGWGGARDDRHGCEDTAVPDPQPPTWQRPPDPHTPSLVVRTHSPHAPTDPRSLASNSAVTSSPQTNFIRPACKRFPFQKFDFTAKM